MRQVSFSYDILSTFHWDCSGRYMNPVVRDMHDVNTSIEQPLLDTRMIHDHLSHTSNKPFVVDDPGKLPHPTTDIAIAFVVIRFSETK